MLKIDQNFVFNERKWQIEISRESFDKIISKDLNTNFAKFPWLEKKEIEFLKAFTH